MTAHEVRVECFRKHLNKFSAGGKGFAGKEVKEEWYKSAVKNFTHGLVSDDFNTVVGLYDTSLFGKGKEGILFTDKVFMWKNIYSSGYTYLKDISDVYVFDDSKDDKYKGIIIHCCGKAIVCNDGHINTTNIFWEGYCSLKCGAFISFMKEFLIIH